MSPLAPEKTHLLMRLLLSVGFLIWCALEAMAIDERESAAEVDSLLRLVEQQLTLDLYEAEHLAHQAFDMAQRESLDSQMISAQNLLGGVYVFQAKYDSARALLQASLEKGRSRGYQWEEARSLHLIGMLYWYLEEYPQALEYAQLARSRLSEKRHVDLLMHILTLIGNTCSSLGQLDSAQAAYFQVISLALEAEDQHMLASSYTNLAVLYERNQEYEKSLLYHQKALQTFRYDGVKTGEFYSLVNLGSVYQQMGRTPMALDHLYQAKSLIDSLNMLSEKVWLLNELYHTYRTTARVDSTLKYAEAYYQWKDSLFNADRMADLRALEAQLAHQQEVDLLTHRAELEASRRQTWTIGLAAVGLLLGVLAYSFFLRARNNQLARRTVEEEKERMEQERDEVEEQQAHLQDTLHHQQQELSVATLRLLEKNEWLQQLQQELNALRENKDPNAVAMRIAEIQRQIVSHLHGEEDWESVKLQFEQVHPQFFDRLLSRNPNLSPRDLRVSAYLRMNMSSKEIARLMNYSLRGVDSLRYRLRKKLDIPSDQDLNIWMIQF